MIKYDDVRLGLLHKETNICSRLLSGLQNKTQTKLSRLLVGYYSGLSLCYRTNFFTQIIINNTCSQKKPIPIGIYVLWGVKKSQFSQT